MKRWIVLMSLTVMIVSCAAVKTTQPLDLNKKVEVFWSFKKDGDWKNAYTCYCNAYREKVLLDNYVHSSNLKVVAFSIDSIVKSEGNQEALVTVSFDTETNGFTLNGIKITEKWIYEDNQWVVCPEQTEGFKELFKNP